MMNNRELCCAMQKISKFEVGDRVKVLRSFRQCEMGGPCWATGMKRTVGMTGEIVEIRDNCVTISFLGMCQHYDYPFFVLEMVRKRKSSQFNDFKKAVKCENCGTHWYIGEYEQIDCPGCHCHPIQVFFEFERETPLKTKFLCPLCFTIWEQYETGNLECPSCGTTNSKLGERLFNSLNQPRNFKEGK